MQHDVVWCNAVLEVTNII